SLSTLYLLPFYFISFIDPAPTEIYTLSLHDALPIFELAAVACTGDRRPLEFAVRQRAAHMRTGVVEGVQVSARVRHVDFRRHLRSEEHTSELQSRENLVCRLLLEKKNKQPTYISLRV